MLSCLTRIFGLVSLVLAIATSTAFGASTPKILAEFGQSRPPIGYVMFCKRGAEECKAIGGRPERAALTDETWDEINQVNHLVNSAVKPASDTDIYHVTDYWTYPTLTGDCEDYALLKKQLLVQLGFNPDELLMTVVFDENGEGHAILTFLTQRADLILDNRRNEILSVDQTSYKFVKRQSQLDPTQWVSLRKTDTQVLVSSQSR